MSLRNMSLKTEYKIVPLGFQYFLSDDFSFPYNSIVATRYFSITENTYTLYPSLSKSRFFIIHFKILDAQKTCRDIRFLAKKFSAPLVQLRLLVTSKQTSVLRSGTCCCHYMLLPPVTFLHIHGPIYYYIVYCSGIMVIVCM